MANEFAVGDRVVVKPLSFLEAHKRESFSINSYMMKYAECETVVRNVSGNRIALECDNGFWNWDENWIDHNDSAESFVEDISVFNDMF